MLLGTANMSELEDEQSKTRVEPEMLELQDVKVAAVDPLFEQPADQASGLAAVAEALNSREDTGSGLQLDSRPPAAAQRDPPARRVTFAEPDTQPDESSDAREIERQGGSICTVGHDG